MLRWARLVTLRGWVLSLAGFASLVLAGFLWHPVAGFLALGISLLLLENLTSPEAGGVVRQ